MFVSSKVISVVVILAHAVSGMKEPRNLVLDPVPPVTGGECFVAGSMSCNPPLAEYVCDEINGHKYWTVTEISTENGPDTCNTKCVAESDLESLLDGNWECGPCRVCSSNHRCKLDGDKVKYSFWKLKDNDTKCEEKCKEGDKYFDDMMADGYTCGFCPGIYSTKSGNKDPIVVDPLAPPPCPRKCVLKRNDHIMRYEPNWPAIDDDVTVEILSGCSCTIYPFPATTFDTDAAEFRINNDDIFDDLWSELREKQDIYQSVSVRFCNKNGCGEWDSCDYSPIAIDLNNDGEVTRIQPKDVGRTEGWTIDITGDGEMEYLNEWFGPKEGILVDLSGQYGQFQEEANKQGRRVQDLIITGTQLLGDEGGRYADGFQKLKAHDVDGNGIVDGSELLGFHIWVDSNSNAKLDDNELFNLIDFGIIGIRVTHNKYMSTAILVNGKELLTEDLWFNRRRRALQEGNECSP